MSVLEIVFGVLVMLLSAVVIAVILAQDSKGQGLSSVITGTEMMSGESRAHSKEARQTRITKIAGIIFFALIVLVNFFGAIAK